jgi:methylglyoxal synthase
MNRKYERVTMSAKKRIALIAHDSRKDDLLDWVGYNSAVLREHDLLATGTTGALVHARWGLSVERFKSGPLGGDQQIGAKIAGGEIDVLVFFWDPLEPHPHEPDVRALLRVAVLYNIPIACNRATADFIVASPLIHGEYDRLVADHGAARDAFVRSRVG